MKKLIYKMLPAILMGATMVIIVAMAQPEPQDINIKPFTLVLPTVSDTLEASNEAGAMIYYSGTVMFHNGQRWVVMLDNAECMCVPTNNGGGNND